ncbi:hypothetical protein SPRG_12188 [Saprolegnia parasitica CBS 223.65]|uniref:Thioredoxin domain-containing protein n=1 Tax=Saprolegnia parasitica (strain CBS 223.65) TaxID=695850 RepID=A0A067C8A4_SAPPC|nr:hypothetical protein SPRG_12188 [Saprolegnia parasitica CBS 223.65]KDO22761.1 hypothetical protein SPRG_12188 [Saprolegnia parasitica CBS 223.65]|eukprot:XP_012206545.1 hypothetical protein SPRG_12188 [Saprolegnia parasitica CBS 223.65]
MKTTMLLGVALAACVALAGADIAAGSTSFDAKMAEQAKNLHKFMPGPTGPGFKDKGMTNEAEFAQMGRFGIPDLNNPTAEDLTDLNFDTAIAGDAYVAVLFYAPSMDDFEFVALHWEKASMELHESSRLYTSASIRMARLDISEPEHGEIAELYRVDGDKPTMLLFHNGSVVQSMDARGGHTEIQARILSTTLPAVTHITSDAELKKWKRRKVYQHANIKFLAVLDDAPSSLASYEAVCSEIKRRAPCGYVSDRALLGAIDVDPSARHFLLRDFDAPRVVPYLTDAFTAKGALELVADYDMPLLTDLGDKDESRVRNFLSHPKTFRLLAFFKTEAAKAAATPHLEAVGKAFGRDLLVAYTVEDPEDAMNFDYQFWDVPSDVPAILVVHMRRDRKYLYAGPDAHSADQILSFVENVLRGDVQPKLKSQASPTPNNGAVRVLVTNSFAKEVWQAPQADTLLLLTRSERHGPSQWFTQQLDVFAKVWRREKRLLVARMDMQHNDLLELSDDELATLPKLVYISRDAKTTKSLGPAMSQLYPTMDELRQFVQMHQSMDLVVDEKVWARVYADDLELLRQHREAQAANADIEHPGDILKEIEAEIEAMQHAPKDEL